MRAWKRSRNRPDNVGARPFGTVQSCALGSTYVPSGMSNQGNATPASNGSIRCASRSIVTSDPPTLPLLKIWPSIAFVASYDSWNAGSSFTDRRAWFAVFDSLT